MMKKDKIPPWKDSDFRAVIGSSSVDYDKNKECFNRKKHKYALESAVYFLTRYLLPIPQPPYAFREAGQVNGEIRHEHMTVDIDGTIVFFVSTMRPNETVRILSLRRASSKEVNVFKIYTGYQRSNA